MVMHAAATMKAAAAMEVVAAEMTSPGEDERIVNNWTAVIIAPVIVRVVIGVIVIVVGVIVIRAGPIPTETRPWEWPTKPRWAMPT